MSIVIKFEQKIGALFGSERIRQRSAKEKPGTGIEPRAGPCTEADTQRPELHRRSSQTREEAI